MLPLVYWEDGREASSEVLWPSPPVHTYRDLWALSPGRPPLTLTPESSLQHTPPCPHNTDPGRRHIELRGLRHGGLAVQLA